MDLNNNKHFQIIYDFFFNHLFKIFCIFSKFNLETIVDQSSQPHAMLMQSGQSHIMPTHPGQFHARSMQLGQSNARPMWPGQLHAWPM